MIEYLMYIILIVIGLACYNENPIKPFKLIKSIYKKYF